MCVCVCVCERACIYRPNTKSHGNINEDREGFINESGHMPSNQTGRYPDLSTPSTPSFTLPSIMQPNHERKDGWRKGGRAGGSDFKTGVDD